MREKLNENPVAQIALLGVLAIAVGYLVLSSMGGGSGGGGATEAPAAGAESVETTEVAISGEPTGGEAVGTAPEIAAATSAMPAPASHPLPRKVDAAYKHNKIIVVLLVRDGAVDDHVVRRATHMLEGNSHVALFSAKAKDVARFAALTGPLGINRVPALIVVRPKHLNKGGPAPASVTYGLNSQSGIRTTIREAVYKGPHLTYAPQ